MMVGDHDERPGQPQAACVNGISPRNESRESLLTLDQRNSSSDLFISISGLIGAGKSTLATKLGERMNLPVFYEPVIDNVYLSDFYKDPARYSFPLQVSAKPPCYRSSLLQFSLCCFFLQVYLLNRRFQQHQQIIWTGRGGVQDRTIYEDSVFAKVAHPRNQQLYFQTHHCYCALFAYRCSKTLE